MKKKFPLLAKFVIIGAVLFVLIQFVPYGKTVTNPPVINEPDWDSPVTKDIIRTSCYDCHSNETTHPWYSKVAPASWLLKRDVDEGRHELNFSNWPTDKSEQQEIVNEILEVISEGEMPPIQYTLFHPDSKLTAEEVKQVSAGLIASISQ